VAFTKERLSQFPDVPTMIEKGKDFSYYNQRAVVGAPGMSADAAAYYEGVFKKIFEGDDWQGYLKKNALDGNWISAADTKAYWQEQLARHKALLGE
jgi:putative tricarboxylic transport membrane protein